jgi:hypothetical protein
MNAEIEEVTKQGWEEIQAPELIKLEKPGDQVCGVLLDLRMEHINDQGQQRDVMTARMEIIGGKQVKFRPSFDLQQKIGRRHIGRILLIVFDTELDTGKDSKMKIFKVFVKSETATDEPPFVGTDVDLPGTF